ncbi:MAG: BNR/Asp-box repeat protein [Candidatus Eremiobacteraeota bacterium]|nr:BNR/Asp-box repeat protein [Candidatus Eremiobacteraeota bacterium]
MQVSSAFRAVLAALLFILGAAAAPAQQPASEASPSAAPAPAASASPSPSPSPSPVPPYNRLAFREIGPALSGGRVTSVVGVADDAKLYYLGSAGGGVWKTVNGGATWSAVFEKQNVASIGAVAIDPKNHDVVWAGTGETNPRNDVTWGDGVYRTADGGKTWTNLGLAQTKFIASVVIDPRDTNTVLVGALGDAFADSPERGVYRTTDGGKTWSKTLYVGPRSGVSEMVADPKNPDVLYAGIWRFQRKPWTFESGGAGDGIWKSTDGGKTWNQLTGHGLPEGMTGRIGLAVAPSNPNRVYALIESKTPGILWRSDDAGATWKLMTTNTLVDQRFFYFSHVRVDPANADHVYGVSEELSESKDGGKTFKAIADGVHVDYHDMWISPSDSKRMIVGEDGGYAISLDGGAAWSFSRNLAIGQIYHIGYDDQNPYRVCVGLQDNNGFCGPSNSLRADGIPDEAWERVIGGDGQWAWPDPRDPNLVWTDLQNGNLTVYDRRTQRSRPVRPYLATAAQGFAPYALPYRFNWNSPIAFDPFDHATALFGGNVVFASRDRGLTWRPISPDLTRNDKTHQQASGGPLALDNTGAEATSAILDIEPSTATRGEIWVGTDDGLVQVTRDAGKHWTNVTPPNVPPDGRVEVAAPSPLTRGTAYAVIDRHYLGDHTPYAFVTHDWGAHWTTIANGLPAQEARAIRPDTRNAHLVYLGLENSFWLSYDDGAHWRKPALGLPTTASYDLRIQPRWNDLIVATHGRGAYILDDLTPIQELPRAEAAGAALFAPRPAYLYALHANDEGLYTRYAGKNPPAGAMISFYQATPGAKSPSIEILDPHGAVIRHLRGTTRVNEREIPVVTNFAGVNRVTWDMREDGPVRWNGAAKETYKGPRTGLPVIPGAYSVRIALAGKTFIQPLRVESDPRVTISAADYRAARAFAKRHLDEYSRLDATLNRLDAYAASAGSAAGASAGELSPLLRAVREKALGLRGRLTADFTNDEDFIGRPGRIREDLQGLAGFGFGGASGGVPPSAAQREYAGRVDAALAAVLRDVAAFESGDIARADAALKAAGKTPLATSGAKRTDVVGGEAVGEDE